MPGSLPREVSLAKGKNFACEAFWFRGAPRNLLILLTHEIGEFRGLLYYVATVQNLNHMQNPPLPREIANDHGGAGRAYANQMFDIR
jgi:hypothetical protein